MPQTSYPKDINGIEHAPLKSGSYSNKAVNFIWKRDGTV